MKKILCFIFGHRWDHWIWAEDRDYACNRCKRWGVIGWGCTLEYGRTYGARFKEGYRIIEKGA